LAIGTGAGVDSFTWANGCPLKHTRVKRISTIGKLPICAFFIIVAPGNLIFAKWFKGNSVAKKIP
jgi:hypothetical protein